MLEDPSNVVFGLVTDQCVTLLVVENVLAVFPQTLMGMHSRPIILKDGLWHHSDRLAVSSRDVLNHIFVDQHLIGHFGQSGIAHVDFGLPRGTDLVMMNLYNDSTLL